GLRITQQRLSNNDVIWVGANRIRVRLDRGMGNERVTVSQLGTPLYLSSDPGMALADEAQDGSLLARKLSGLQAILEVFGRTRDPTGRREHVVATLLDVVPAADSVVVLAPAPPGSPAVMCRKDRLPGGAPGFTIPDPIIQHVVRDRRGILLGDPDAGTG